MGKKYEKDYEINYYQVDPKLNCSIESIIGMLGDMGSAQSDALGIGVNYCAEKNKTWVFYQYDIKINRYPKCYDKIKIITDPSGFKKFYASRDYSIIDTKTEESLVEASAIFFYIDLEKRRATRIPNEEYILYGIDETTNKDIKVERLEKLKEAQYKKNFKVRYSDIDSNRHVNNTNYIEWAIEALPIEFVVTNNLNRLQVTFEKECTYGDDIVTLAEIRENQDGSIQSFHSIETPEGKVLSTLIFYWNK